MPASKIKGRIQLYTTEKTSPPSVQPIKRNVHVSVTCSKVGKEGGGRGGRGGGKRRGDEEETAGGTWRRVYHLQAIAESLRTIKRNKNKLILISVRTVSVI